ncbi:hypothetical protein V6N11_038016 [Hibiscus sabdariffa]|uniref:NB-ARC domain-containing protein n=1 Tax=Hibiscus sabdariffa TaxID=183260 RepID=A0ABR1ZLT3_9ROSI
MGGIYMMEKVHPTAMMRETSKRLREWMAVMDLRMSGASEESDVLEKRKVMARIPKSPISVILEQVRAIKYNETSPHFVEAVETWRELELLVHRLNSIVDKMDVLWDWPLEVQLSSIEMDVFSLDEVLYDIEDLIGFSKTQPMQSNIQTDLAETLEVSKGKTERLGVSMSRNPKSSISISKSMTKFSDRFKSSVSMLEKDLTSLEMKWLLFDLRWRCVLLYSDSILVEVSRLYGIDQVKKDIMDGILDNSIQERSGNIKPISIVGMEGMGKTSLAQCICKDKQVVASFGKIVLVDVSGDFDLHKIARDIIQSLEGLNHDFLHILTLVPLQSLIQ